MHFTHWQLIEFKYTLILAKQEHPYEMLYNTNTQPFFLQNQPCFRGLPKIWLKLSTLWSVYVVINLLIFIEKLNKIVFLPHLIREYNEENLHERVLHDLRDRIVVWIQKALLNPHSMKPWYNIAHAIFCYIKLLFSANSKFPKKFWTRFWHCNELTFCTGVR